MKLEEIISRMHNHGLYNSDDSELADEQLRYLDMVYDYNHIKPSHLHEKEKLLKKMFAQIGEGCHIETPFYANWGGKHVSFGNHVYANFNLVLVDDTSIHVGDHVMFGPNVVLCTGTHPVSPDLREEQFQYNLPIRIGNNVWIGANSIVMPGVTIGAHSVIGAGSIVTKDIPENVVAFGNPCEVRRSISDRDKKYYHKDLEIDLDFNKAQNT